MWILKYTAFIYLIVISFICMNLSFDKKYNIKNNKFVYEDIEKFNNLTIYKKVIVISIGVPFVIAFDVIPNKLLNGTIYVITNSIEMIEIYYRIIIIPILEIIKKLVFLCKDLLLYFIIKFNDITDFIMISLFKSIRYLVTIIINLIILIYNEIIIPVYYINFG